MLEIKKTVINLEEGDLLELERIITDEDEKEAYAFLKNRVYNAITLSQKGKLKSHLDTGINPVDTFTQSIH